MNNESLSKEQKIELFRSLFKGREDVFAQRWESQDGQRSAYYPAYNKGNLLFKNFRKSHRFTIYMCLIGLNAGVPIEVKNIIYG